MSTLLRGVRILRLSSWSWDDNACTVHFTPADPGWTACLPPLASPCATYVVRVDEGSRTVVSWVVEEPQWVAFDFLGELGEAALLGIREALGLAPETPRERILEEAAKRDVQVLAAQEGWCGLFDGVGLSEKKRARLFENFSAFGRHRARNTKKPHNVVLAQDTDALEFQFVDLSRSEDAGVCHTSAAAAAWRALRTSRACGVPFSKESIIKSYGQEVANILEEDAGAFDEEQEQPGEETAALGERTAPTWTVVLVGASTNICSNNAPLDFGNDHIPWFASCIASADRHPRKHFLLRNDIRSVGAYAVHEREGGVYVVSVSNNEATCSDGRVVSRGGLTYVAQIAVAEGTSKLFRPGSLRRVGIYCRTGDGRTWTSSLLHKVLSLLAPGGTVCTNCVSNNFIPR